MEAVGRGGGKEYGKEDQEEGGKVREVSKEKHEEARGSEWRRVDRMAIEGEEKKGDKA